MKAPIHSHSPGARSAALFFAVLHLVLAVGVSHDVEAHRLEATARLPREFHHHDFSLTERSPDVRPSIVGECLACHLSRLVPRLHPSGIVSGPTPEILADQAPVSQTPPNRLAPSPRVSRGPPTLTV